MWNNWGQTPQRSSLTSSLHQPAGSLSWFSSSAAAGLSWSPLKPSSVQTPSSSSSSLVDIRQLFSSCYSSTICHVICERCKTSQHRCCFILQPFLQSTDPLASAIWTQQLFFILCVLFSESLRFKKTHETLNQVSQDHLLFQNHAWCWRNSSCDSHKSDCCTKVTPTPTNGTSLCREAKQFSCIHIMSWESLPNEHATSVSKVMCVYLCV